MIADNFSKLFIPSKPRNRVVIYLAMHGESTPYEIAKSLYGRIITGYSTVATSIKSLERKQLIQLVRVSPSLKKGKKKVYDLTPLLGFTMALACADDATGLTMRTSKLPGYLEVQKAYRASIRILGEARFKQLVRESLVPLLHDRGKKIDQRRSEKRLMNLFIERLISDETREKEVIEICKESSFVAGYLQRMHKLTSRVLSRIGIRLNS